MVGFVGMNVNMPLLFDEGCAALPLYALGKYVYPYMKRILTNKLLMTVGVLALLAFALRYVSFTIVPQGNGQYAPLYVVAISVMALTFFPVLYLSGKLQGQKWLDCLGRHSLGIMLLHAPMCHTAAVVFNRLFAVGSVAWIVSFLAAYVAIVAMAYWLTLMIERHCPVLLGK